MRSKISSLLWLIALLILPVAVWILPIRLTAIYYSLSKTPEEILISQLKGDGCGYQRGCKFDWEHYSGYNVRNSDLHCPMMAAKCILKLIPKSENIIQILNEASAKQPPSLDTGDGIIKYKTCIDEIVEAMQSGTTRIPEDCST